jgi:hypothetical protein
MGYFSQAVSDIASIGAFGDCNIEGERAYAHDDRSKRIKSAADSLCDYVHEYILSYRGEELRFKHFTQDDLNMIAHMIAVGMEAQFDYDLEHEIQSWNELEVQNKLARRLVELGTDKKEAESKAHFMIWNWEKFSEHSQDETGHQTARDWLDSDVVRLLDQSLKARYGVTEKVAA